MLKDMIAGFELYQPTDVETALELLDRYGADGWAMAGGYDSLDWFKDRAKEPRAVIDLQGIAELRGIRETTQSLEIGALTTLTEIESHPLIQARFELLAEAARRVASPQIRNAGTLGGNICQDTRCWYYRYGVKCYRAGGNTCYAAAPDAMNREHALFGANRCVAVSPSDTAPALVALDAEMVVRNVRGERVIAAGDFFMEPAVDIRRMTVLNPGDLLTAVRLPDTWAGADFYFEKAADRKSWDFALASVAAAFRTNGSTIEDSRIVCGAVQCVPRRLRSVERMLRGKARSETVAEAAGDMAVRGAEPLSFNHFKIPLMANLVKRAVRGTT
ncbi:MAG: xanthine dehydrogenase family protein subunit M [Gemmatimonadetes bacterium]|nr:xanthine dehydrogenase family protein subunit M [Gemmatimonadota bacterium]MDA1102477.1 xanthine dehydrogenase family protein subunit M [Gemmatimonadota bacterium]